jgi:hypothetical protein
MRLNFQARLLLIFFGLAGAACNSTSPTDNALREGRKIVFQAVAVPQITDLRTGQMREAGRLAFGGEAVVRKGKATIIPTQGRPAFAPGDTTITLGSMTDSVIAGLLPQLGFTTNSGGPTNSAPDGSGAGADTVDFTADGAAYQVIRTRGTYGEPLIATTYKNGIAIFTERRTWQSMSGGIILARVIFTDLTDPEVQVRTNVDITTTKIITLSLQERFRPAAGEMLTRAGALCLPQALYALRAGAGCAAAIGVGIIALGRLVYTSAKLVAAVRNPFSPATWSALYEYMEAITGLSAAGVGVGAACKK